MSGSEFEGRPLETNGLGACFTFGKESFYGFGEFVRPVVCLFRSESVDDPAVSVEDVLSSSVYCLVVRVVIVRTMYFDNGIVDW